MSWGAIRPFTHSYRRKPKVPDLIAAAQTGCMPEIDDLLALGEDSLEARHNGRTALHWAASEGHPLAVTALLTAGACRFAVLGRPPCWMPPLPALLPVEMAARFAEPPGPTLRAFAAFPDYWRRTRHHAFPHRLRACVLELLLVFQRRRGSRATRALTPPPEIVDLVSRHLRSADYRRD